MFKKFFFCIFFLVLAFKMVVAIGSTAIDIDLSNYMPVINGIVENRQVSLIFDSGASAPLILKNCIIEKSKNIKRTGKYSRSIDAKGEIQKSPEIIIPNINLNGLVLTNIRGYIYKPWGLEIKDNSGKKEGLVPASFQEKKDGVIGIGLFYNRKVIIDYPAKKIIIFQEKNLPKPYASKHWIKSKIDIGSQGLTVAGRIGNKTATFLIDTGATTSILKKNFVRKNNSRAQRAVKTVAFDAFQIDKLSFYLHDFQEPKVDGILGYNFFQNHIVCLDLVHKEIYFAS